MMVAVKVTALVKIREGAPLDGALGLLLTFRKFLLHASANKTRPQKVYFMV
jgi:hypothetical protein